MACQKKAAHSWQPTENSFAELVKLVKDHHPLKLSNASISTHAITSRQVYWRTCSSTEETLRVLPLWRFSGQYVTRQACLWLYNHRLQCKLLAEDNLTFDTALKIAKAIETVERDSRGCRILHQNLHT